MLGFLLLRSQAGPSEGASKAGNPSLIVSAKKDVASKCGYDPWWRLSEEDIKCKIEP
jgi:hypothetical protein